MQSCMHAPAVREELPMDEYARPGSFEAVRLSMTSIIRPHVIFESVASCKSATEVSVIVLTSNGLYRHIDRVRSGFPLVAARLPHGLPQKMSSESLAALRKHAGEELTRLAEEHLQHECVHFHADQS